MRETSETNSNGFIESGWTSKGADIGASFRMSNDLFGSCTLAVLCQSDQGVYNPGVVASELPEIVRETQELTHLLDVLGARPFLNRLHLGRVWPDATIPDNVAQELDFFHAKMTLA